MEIDIKYKPVYGETYSLFGDSNSTEYYYDFVKRLAGKYLEKEPDIKKLIGIIRKSGKELSRWRFLSKNKNHSPVLAFLSDDEKNQLLVYTKNTAEHLKNLSVFKTWDKTLWTPELQYHLYMLEIELMNRYNKERFNNCAYKISLLPHCLSDFRKKCLAEMGDLDYICKGCTKGCLLNLSSVLLKEYNINPYLLTIRNLRSLFKKLKSEHNSFGVLGIACLPELTNGLRLCDHAGIPAVGIPLDANRCRRWMGICHENSFNLGRLKELIT
jgi:hypothetical protein